MPARASALGPRRRLKLRAKALNKAADLLEAKRDEFMALLTREAGKTYDDGLSEVREAVDFCRFYANEAVRLFGETALPGPTGEDNSLRHRGRGVFVCISPWNFPLAIFAGQVVAALAAGNAVVAKPAEQTPLVAFRMVQLLHEAGVPADALMFVPGDGKIGAALTGASENRRRLLHRLDRNRMGDQPDIGRQERPHRAADRRDRRHERDDRRRHRAAGTGGG